MSLRRDRRLGAGLVCGAAACGGLAGGAFAGVPCAGAGLAGAGLACAKPVAKKPVAPGSETTTMRAIADAKAKDNAVTVLLVCCGVMSARASLVDNP